MGQRTIGIVAQLDDFQYELNQRNSHMLALEVRYGGLSRRVRRILEEEAKTRIDFFSKGTMATVSDVEIFRTPNIGRVAMLEILTWLGRPVPDFIKPSKPRNTKPRSKTNGLKIGAAISLLRGAGYEVVKVGDSAKDRPETRATALKNPR